MSEESKDTGMMACFAGETFDAIKILAIGPHVKANNSGPAALLGKLSPPPPEDVVRTGEHWEFSVVARHQCSDEEAAAVIALWNRLPEAEQMRCHMPGFAIEVLQGSEAVFIAGLCWECHNISIAGRLATESWRKFAPGSDAGVKLLQMCQEVTKTSTDVRAITEDT